MQVEVHRVQAELAGLDTGKVQDVLDDAQQIVRRLSDDLGVFMRFRGKRLIGQKPREAQNPVDGRTDFVAHVGQKARLDATGLLGAAPRQIQLDVLDFELLEGGTQFGVGLIDLALQILAGGEEGVSHGVDAAFQGAQFAA